MSKKLTRREVILKMLKNSASLSCQEITNEIIKKEKLTDNKAYYLSGSISSLLRRMVLRGEIRYSKSKTKRGGHEYELV